MKKPTTIAEIKSCIQDCKTRISIEQLQINALEKQLQVLADTKIENSIEVIKKGKIVKHALSKRQKSTYSPPTASEHIKRYGNFI